METMDSNLRDLSRDRLITLFISSLSFIGFLFTALFKGIFATIDATVNSWSASIHTSSLTQFAEIIAYGFDTTSLLAASLLIAACLFYKNYKKNAFLLVGAMGGDAAVVTITKMLVHSERPLNGIMQEAGFSFPSGHVTSSIVLFGLLSYFACQHWKSSKTKILSSIFLGITAFSVGFSRVYLNVHWFSDVLGGYLLGIFWLTFSIPTLKHANLKETMEWNKHKCATDKVI